MTVFFHIMTSVFCGAECLAALRDLRGRFPRLIMFAGLGLIHGIVPVLTRSDWTMWDASDRSRLVAALLALVGVMLFSAGWRALDVMVPRFRGLSPGLWSNIDSEQGQILLRRGYGHPEEGPLLPTALRPGSSDGGDWLHLRRHHQ